MKGLTQIKRKQANNYDISLNMFTGIYKPLITFFLFLIFFFIFFHFLLNEKGKKKVDLQKIPCCEM